MGTHLLFSDLTMYSSFSADESLWSGHRTDSLEKLIRCIGGLFNGWEMDQFLNRRRFPFRNFHRLMDVLGPGA